jgi:molybdopterin synthase catalytic subunit
MEVSVQFYSYLKELTGCAQTRELIATGATLGELHDHLITRFPKLGAMKRSTLLAVGVDYQPRDFVLSNGDEVSLFPPVQGG